MATSGKAHESPESAVFGPLTSLAFDAVALGANQNNGTVQASLPIPTNFKVFYVAANLTGSPAGTCSINVCAGTAAEGTTGTADTNLTNGQKILANDTALTIAANSNQRFQAAVPDAIIPTSLVATLRTVTNGAAAGTLKVVLLGKFVDPNPTKPLFNSDGTFSF